jgi:hypothetical protein
VDYGSAERLLRSIIDHITSFRDESQFKNIYRDSLVLCRKNSIDIENLDRPTAGRIRKIPARFQDCFIDSTIGHRDTATSEGHHRVNIFYPLIDAILIEMRDRFAPSTSTLLTSLSALHPQSNHFLDTDKIKSLACELDLNVACTMNEISVVLPMFASAAKPLDIIDFFHQILPLKHAFPNVFALITVAITMPVSSTTCERTFSRLKLIKTCVRNTMGHARLSDMAILAIEREITVDLDRTVEQFSKEHKDSRIFFQ